MPFKEKTGRIVLEKNLDFSISDLIPISNWKIHYDKTADQKIIEWDNSDLLDLEAPTIHPDKKSLKNDLIYLQMSQAWSKNSHCQRMKVGCLMVKNKSIISDGYNGSPTGFPNICEDDQMVTLPYVLHAEANAITKLAKSTQSSEGSTIYVTLSPCFECSKLIIQSGIKRLVFSEIYRNPDPLKFLFEAGIEIVKITNHNQI